jgi:hypothetical protein
MACTECRFVRSKVGRVWKVNKYAQEGQEADVI